MAVRLGAEAVLYTKGMHHHTHFPSERGSCVAVHAPKNRRPFRCLIPDIRSSNRSENSIPASGPCRTRSSTVVIGRQINRPVAERQRLRRVAVDEIDGIRARPSPRDIERRQREIHRSIRGPANLTATVT